MRFGLHVYSGDLTERIYDPSKARKRRARKGSHMLDQIKGLHHVTSMAEDARTNNQFFTHALGLRPGQEDCEFRRPGMSIISIMVTRRVRQARS